MEQVEEEEVQVELGYEFHASYPMVLPALLESSQDPNAHLFFGTASLRINS